MPEYAFDVRINGTVRVRAASEAVARAAMRDVLDAADPSDLWVDGYNSKRSDVCLTEVSLTDTEDGQELFEIDGKEV